MMTATPIPQPDRLKWIIAEGSGEAKPVANIDPLSIGSTSVLVKEGVWHEAPIELMVLDMTRVLLAKRLPAEKMAEIETRFVPIEQRWIAKFKLLLSDLPQEHWLTFLDCHI
jgi:hypothetical protein